MATATEERILVSLTLPKPLAKILDDEANLCGTKLPSMVRRIVKSHYGKAHKRHPDSPQVKLKHRKTKQTLIKKQVLIDNEDADHLDTIGFRLGVPRSTAMLITILEYFDIPIVTTPGAS
tara:strand:- start:472 stop:831 length:360 start_codon:yes stop_codon:yes gene_type:complete